MRRGCEDEWAPDHKVYVAKKQRRAFDSCAVKEMDLTLRDLYLSRKTGGSERASNKVQKSAEGIVGGNTEGPNV